MVDEIPSEQKSPSMSEADIYIYHGPELQPQEIHAVIQDTLPEWSLLSSQTLAPRVLLIPATSSTSETSDSLRDKRLALAEVESSFSLQILILPSSIRSPDGVPQLAVFDLDSTLIAAEVIDELARSIGVMCAVSAITECAMNGEIDFAESLRLRVSLLKGVEVPKVWDELKGRVPFMPGARELCRALSRLGVRMAVFSGGFVPMATWVASELGIERVVANQLVSSPANAEFPYKHLTGELDPEDIIVTAEKKREFVKAFAKECGVPLSRVMCVGDGANDLLMLGEVWQHGGLAVAFRAKEKVQREAGNRYNGSSLRDLLFLFGKNEREVEKLVAEQGGKVKTVVPRLMPGMRLVKESHD